MDISDIKEKIKRVEELVNTIEQHKEDTYSVPTYIDSPLLMEAGETLLNIWHYMEHETVEESQTIEILEELIPGFWYMTDAYDMMGRMGMSVKYYKPQLEAHVYLSSIRPYSDEEFEYFEACFYQAIKARNRYEFDECEELIALANKAISQEKTQELYAKALASCREGLQYDPIEKTEKYLSVIDDVEKKVEENARIDFCLEKWNLKAQYLQKCGIVWKSPAQMNPRVMFD